MKEKTKITFKPRKLARRVAKAQLDRKRASGYNKEPVIMGRRGRSRFAREWKGLALEAKAEAESRERARKKAKA